MSQDIITGFIAVAAIYLIGLAILWHQDSIKSQEVERKARRDGLI